MLGEMPTEFDAIVLAGGAGRRMGGVLKPVVPVGGVRMIDRVLEAVAGAARIAVVGPPELRIEGGGPELVRVREDPAGGGPVAAIDAATRFGGLTAEHLVLVAGDLPLLERHDLDILLSTLTGVLDGAEVGAVYTDRRDRPQWLCSAWRTDAIRARLDALTGNRGGVLAGAALRDLFGPLAVVEVRVWRVRMGTDRVTTRADADDLPPWFDCDTQDDITRAEEWLSR